MLKKTKKPKQYALVFRGDERIRTAVGAFAEPSLATRPRRLIWIANLRIFKLLASIFLTIVNSFTCLDFGMTKTKAKARTMTKNEDDDEDDDYDEGEDERDD